MNDRIIKFRAWDKEDKLMLHWHDMPDEIKDAVPYDTGDEWTERCEVMQFTGLTDKNGQEIYEGDIVNADGWIGFIDFHYGAFHVRQDNYVRQQGGIVSARRGMAYYNGESLDKLEVIGNIFEKPMLIEELAKYKYGSEEFKQLLTK